MGSTYRTITLTLIVSVLMGACSLLTPNQTATITIPTATSEPVISPTAASTTPIDTLVIWLAPYFDPELPAGEILSARLNAFETQEADIRITYRIKPASGPGGLVDALQAASVAAPAVVPDLLTLSPEDLRQAAQSNLIQPIAEEVIQVENAAWYDYALPSIRYEDQFYGLPFASEVDILAYRIDLYPEPPRSWEALLAEPRTLLFPAADPRARFILAMYLGAGGAITDENGEPFIDVTALEEVLTLFVTARASGVLPLAVRQYTSPLESWTELKANRSASSMSPLDRFLREGDPERLAAIALPSLNDQGIGLSSTWSWSITTTDPARQALVLDLIKWLSDPRFVGSLTYALGALPTNQEALAEWPEGGDSALASSLVTITQEEPVNASSDKVLPALIDAVEAVLGAGEDPAQAAQAAANQVVP